MKVYKSLDHLPRFNNPVVTVGSFDGVHLGHHQILDYLKKGAKKYDGESVVITFDPHPQIFLHPEREDFFLINSLNDNIKLIEAQGIDHIIIIPFDLEFSQLSFIQFFTILKEKIGLRAIVMGPNHNFGKNREGNCETIQQICAKNGIEVILIPEFIMEENKVRSSKIREHIRNQNFTKAEQLLGYPFKKK
ncbi:MAG TPA: FAD synthetase family protein [Bacteroidales bacterium]|nr:FAD synthetase family protein [Bacteroidales bacterium]